MRKHQEEKGVTQNGPVAGAVAAKIKEKGESLLIAFYIHENTEKVARQGVLRLFDKK